MKISTMLAAATAAFALSVQAEYRPTWESLNSRACPEWWQDAKFGIFIFWGPYSVPAYAPTGGTNVYARYAEHYANRIRKKNPDFMAFHEKHYPGVSYEEFAARGRSTPSSRRSTTVALRCGRAPRRHTSTQ